MKSFYLAVIFVIASLSVGCGADQTVNLDNSGEPKEPALVAHSQATSKDGEQMVSSSPSSREMDTLTGGSTSFVSRGAPVHKNVIAKPSHAASGRSRSTNYSTPSVQGRDNPFALAEQPEFEVRFLAAQPDAVQPLPPVPSVGLGPEAGGASLQPLVAAPAVIQPPTLTTTTIQQSTVAPLPVSLPEPSVSTDLPVVSPDRSGVTGAISPTALAEAVEIKGIVQLGDYSAVIVKDSEGALSRTVQPGARLAGGQVELRRIETTTAEPQVVLMQNGIEIVRGVGV